MEIKICSVCHKPFPATSEYFYADNRYDPPRLRSACKKCQMKRDAQSTDPEKLLAKTRRYREKHVDQCRARCRDWSAKHKTERKAYDHQRHQEFPDQLRQAAAEWKRNNPDRVRATTMAWRKQHRADYLAVGHRWRARKRGLTNAFTGEDWDYALNYFGNRCAYCGRPAGNGYHLAMDHWIPITSPECPGTIPTNIVPACGSNTRGITGACNNGKSNLHPHQWVVKRFGEVQASEIINRIEAYFDHLRALAAADSPLTG